MCLRNVAVVLLGWSLTFSAGCRQQTGPVDPAAKTSATTAPATAATAAPATAAPATAAPATAAPTLPVPASWKPVSDRVVDPARTAEVAARLGGEIAVLRNAVYGVDGKHVQLNTIVAVDRASANRIMTGLRRMKSDEALLQRGAVVYELVGGNDVLDEIRRARAMIAAKLPE